MSKNEEYIILEFKNGRREYYKNGRVCDFSKNKTIFWEKREANSLEEEILKATGEAPLIIS